VYKDRAHTEQTLSSLIAATAQTYGLAAMGRWRTNDDALGEGYGIPTQAGLDAIGLLARTEGILLDPVYTSKAFAWMLDRIAAGRLEGPVVFLHTGGSFGLFAYTAELTGRRSPS
jgi:D-cysteine desulfhydrase